MRVILPTVRFFVLQKLLHYYRFQCNKGQKKVYSTILAYVATAKDILFPVEKPAEEITPGTSVKPNIIRQADSLFVQQRYKEAYELLNHYRHSLNPNVLWRLSRILFCMTSDTTLSDWAKEDIINEAYLLIKKGLINGSNCADVHKWLAIILDARSGQEGIHKKIQAIPEIRSHLKRALELDPGDITVLYMLGHLSYQLASLTWFQRQLVTIFFGPPPTSSYEEAYNYFLQVEIQKPRYFTSNMFMLARSCYDMGNYYRAKFYFDIATGLPCRNETEKTYREKAKKFSEELESYDISKDALYNEEKLNY